MVDFQLVGVVLASGVGKALPELISVIVWYWGLYSTRRKSPALIRLLPSVPGKSREIEHFLDLHDRLNLQRSPVFPLIWKGFPAYNSHKRAFAVPRVKSPCNKDPTLVKISFSKNFFGKTLA